MAAERSIGRYRRWYARLLRFYPRPYHRRFGQPMEQTFTDLLRERAGKNRGLLGGALWMCLETLTRILGENMTTLIRPRNPLLRPALVTALLLLVPFAAIQLGDDVVWGPIDFAVAGVLLFGAGIAYELLARRRGDLAYRLAAGLAVATSLFLVWANLAVGLIGSEHNPANLLYGGVLAVGVIGAILARWQAAGMARAMFATALAQACVPVIVLTLWKSGLPAGEDLRTMLGANALFVILFAGSALLFLRAGATGPGGTSGRTAAP